MKKRFLLVLWLTRRCNLKCRYCYASDNEAKRDMDFETAKLVIDRMRNEPLKIQFAGGEPLLNFELAKKICEYVKSERIDAVFQMQTNATLLNREVAHYLKMLGISVGVSLDGIPEVNELTRGKSSDVVNGIRYLANEKMMIGLNAVVTSQNIHKLEQFVDFAFYLGNVGGIGLDLLRKAGMGNENYDSLAVNAEQLKSAIKGMSARSDELYHLSGKRIEIREIEKAKKRLRSEATNMNYCYASCGHSIVVLPDGRIYPCGSLLNEKYYIGMAEEFDYTKIKPLTCQKSRKCEVCKYQVKCAGGCPSRKLRNENDLDCVLLETAFELAQIETEE